MSVRCVCLSVCVCVCVCSVTAQTRVMQSCRGDGVVLKPSRPVTRIDACFRNVDGRLQKFDPTCHQYSTYSDLG